MALAPIRELGRRGCDWDGVESLIGLNPDDLAKVVQCKPQDLAGYDKEAVKLTLNSDDAVIYAAGTVQEIINLSWGIGCVPENSDTE